MKTKNNICSYDYCNEKAVVKYATNGGHTKFHYCQYHK